MAKKSTALIRNLPRKGCTIFMRAAWGNAKKSECSLITRDMEGWAVEKENEPEFHISNHRKRVCLEKTFPLAFNWKSQNGFLDCLTLVDFSENVIPD